MIQMFLKLQPNCNSHIILFLATIWIFQRIHFTFALIAPRKLIDCCTSSIHIKCWQWLRNTKLIKSKCLVTVQSLPRYCSWELGTSNWCKMLCIHVFSRYSLKTLLLSHVIWLYYFIIEHWSFSFFVDFGWEGLWTCIRWNWEPLSFSESQK